MEKNSKFEKNFFFLTILKFCNFLPNKLYISSAVKVQRKILYSLFYFYFYSKDQNAKLVMKRHFRLG